MRRLDVRSFSLYVPATSQVRLKWNTQWRLDGTWPRRLCDVLLELHNNVSKGRNSGASSLRLHDVSNKFQMKHPTTSRSNVAMTSQWCVSTTSYWNVIMTSQREVATTPQDYVSTVSQTSLKWNTQRSLSGTLPKNLSGTYPWRPISTSLRRLL